MTAAGPVRGPYRRITVVEPGGTTAGTGIACRLDHELKMKPRHLADYCQRGLDPKLEDLLTIAAAVAFADRAVQRWTFVWRRQLALALPVRDPGFWRDTRVVGALSDVLNFVTGDEWTFEFRLRRDAVPLTPQGALRFPEGQAAVIPFSDGLDSLAAAHLAKADDPDLRLVLLTVGHRSITAEGWRDRGLGGRQHRAYAPIRTVCGGSVRAREASGRGRAFLYGVLAGAAARLLDTPRVILPESGQGSVGPWLVQDGHEWPDFRCNPLFTRRLAAFLNVVFREMPGPFSPVRFEHPHLWRTKAETLTDLRDAGRAGGWVVTRSCARHPRQLPPREDRLGCGVCPACFLRRYSLHASGLARAGSCGEQYHWPTLAAERSPDDGINDNRRSHAVTGAYDTARLAHLGIRPDDRVACAVATLALETGRPAEEVERDMNRLLAANRAEVLAFADTQGPESLLRFSLDLVA